MADMTAAQLIALLREHPGTCAALNVSIKTRLSYPPTVAFARAGDDCIECDDDAPQFIADRFCRWLVGAITERYDQLRLEHPKAYDMVSSTRGRYRVYVFDSEFYDWNQGISQTRPVEHPTRLHAQLAGLLPRQKEAGRG